MLNSSEETTKETSGLKKLAFHAVTIVLSFLLALLIVEIILRNLDYTSNLNTGKAAFERWMAKHWRANELGYRDLLIAPRLSSTKPKIYFLGDSFTAGAGVEFKDTYYFKTGFHLENDYNLFNIARPGLSTLGEHRELDSFLNSDPSIVVHQYFINDIVDYISEPSWEQPDWLEALDRHLESVQLIESYFLNKAWGENYKTALLGAYQNPSLLKRHKNDLRMLHTSIRDKGGVIVFLAFPALSSKDIGDFTFVVNEMRGFFSETCQPDDIFIDATPAALSLEESRRIVSFLDQHPSPELHSLIANQIIRAIRREDSDAGSYKYYENCSDMQKNNWNSK